MDEDRRPLGDLLPSEFYGEGCDATSYVTVDAGIERPSRLSKEVNVEESSENVDPVKKDVEPAPAVEETIVAAAEHVEASKSQEAVVTLPEEEATTIDTTSQAINAAS